MSRHVQYPDECVHFNGIHHARCRAGVGYRSVEDRAGPGMTRWPCLTLIGREAARTTCAKRRLKTPEDHDREEDEINAAVEAMFAAEMAGKCHVCGSPAEPSKLVGRCRYNACGHRRGQEASEEDE